MRYVRTVLLVTAAALTSACFQFSTVVTLKPDGSGTIDQRLLFSQAAVAQLRLLAGPNSGGDFEPVSEQQAREGAAALGPGVTYVSSTPINSAEGVGRAIVYAFPDINALKLDQAPPPPGGVPTPPGADTNASSRVSFKFARQANGNALLTIGMPQLPALGADPNQPTGGPTAEQLAMIKPMLAGARLSIGIEPVGRLVRTSSPYVTGNRIVLLDVNVDALFADPTLIQRLQAAKSPDEAKTILKDVPGLKANLDPELTIEFQ
jgi:hypothetical protein